METVKVRNLIVRIFDIADGIDERGEFETLLANDEQGKTYSFSFRNGWANYKRFNNGDVILIKSARKFETSPSLSFLYYLRIKH